MMLMAEYRRLSGTPTLPSPKSHDELPSNRQYRFVRKFIELIRDRYPAKGNAPDDTLIGVLTERSRSHLSLIRLLNGADRDFATVSLEWANSFLLPQDAEDLLSLIGTCRPRPTRQK
jgi:hypothetical protein